jgi:carbon monoxide dehydrogenase subunit G
MRLSSFVFLRPSGCAQVLSFRVLVKENSVVEIVGSYVLEVPIDDIWPRIFDPQSLMSLIPGCQELEQVSTDEYRGNIQVGIAAVSGRYDTYVRVVERDPPHRCCFEGEISGATGTIKGEASFTLKEVEERNNLIEYQAKGIITGALAKLSPRFVEGVAQTLIKLGLTNLNRQLQAQILADTADHFEE